MILDLGAGILMRPAFPSTETVRDRYINQGLVDLTQLYIAALPHCQHISQTAPHYHALYNFLQ